MTLMENFQQTSLPESFHWFNQPARFKLGSGLEIFTDENTDFWQNTHYGFQNDNGHCLFTTQTGDFSLVTRVEFRPLHKYDQCGLMVRIDRDNWIKSFQRVRGPGTQPPRIGGHQPGIFRLGHPGHPFDAYGNGIPHKQEGKRFPDREFF